VLYGDTPAVCFGPRREHPLGRRARAPAVDGAGRAGGGAARAGLVRGRAGARLVRRAAGQPGARGADARSCARPSRAAAR
jgi:hypothetical protein